MTIHKLVGGLVGLVGPWRLSPGTLGARPHGPLAAVAGDMGARPHGPNPHKEQACRTLNDMQERKKKEGGKRENWSGEGREWKRRVDADTDVQKQI